VVGGPRGKDSSGDIRNRLIIGDNIPRPGHHVCPVLVQLASSFILQLVVLGLGQEWLGRAGGISLSYETHDRTVAHFFLFISHVPPSLSSKYTLPGSLLLVTKDLLDEIGLTPDGGEKHKVGAEGLLGSIGVLDVRSSRETSLALSRPEFVLAFDVLRSERLLPGL
jgi:hypothetical protein